MLDDPMLVLLLAALQLHYLTPIVNVHWEDGLAVEFFDGADGEHETA